MKHLLLLLAAILLATGAKAQDEEVEKKKGEFRVNFGYDFGLKEGSNGVVSFQPEYGWQVVDNFYLGIGTGVLADDGFNNFYIPAFVRGELTFSKYGSITPYIALQAGYDFSTGDGDGEVRINPNVGIKVPIGKTTDLHLSVGYSRLIVDGGGADCLGAKIGFSFNSGGKGLGTALHHFFRTTDWTIELETNTAVEASQVIETTSRSTTYTSTYTQKYSSIYGIRFSGIRKIAKNFYLGLSVGGGIKKVSEELKYDEASGTDGWSYDEDDGYYEGFVRLKYKFKQLTFAKKFYPFLLVDAGVSSMGYGEATFQLNPTIGLSYMTGDKSSIDLSVGYTQIDFSDGWDYDYEMDDKKGSIRISLGYTF